MKRIVTISGTNRPGNYTSMAVGVLNDELQQNGVEPIFLDARELELAFPGQPETADARRLQAAIESADGVVLATPEYHGSFSAMTKLIIENLGFPSRWRGKPVALLGVAAGRIGAVKSLEMLRGICAHTGAIVVPGAISIAGVQSAFDEEGNCTDPGTDKVIRSVVKTLLQFHQEYFYPREALEAIVRGEVDPWTAAF